MSSKKKRNKTTVSQLGTFGIPVGVKFLGKPIRACFTVLDTENVQEIYGFNSEDFEFTVLDESLIVFDDVELLHSYSKGSVSLGVILLVDDSKLSLNDNQYVLEGEFLPFKEGENRYWRNPKFGFALTEVLEEDFVFDETLRLSVLFPKFDDVYFIEQVVNPTGISDSMFEVVSKNLVKILK